MKKLYGAAFAILLLGQVFSYLKIIDLENRIISFRSYMDNQMTNQENSIYNISSLVGNELEKQADPLNSFDYKLVNITDDLNVIVEVNAVPKQIAEDTTVYIKYKGDEIPLEKNGTDFKGILEVPLNNDVEVNVIVESSNLKTLSQSKYIYSQECIPRIYGYYIGENSETHQGNVYTYKLDGYFEFNIENTDMMNFKEAKIVVKLDDEEVFEKNIDLKNIDRNINKNIEINEKFESDKQKSVYIYLYAKDDFGLNYSQLIDYAPYGNYDDSIPEMQNTTIITDKHGNEISLY